LKFDLTLALPDRPGQLLRALEPIAKNSGNIISIIHEREKPTEGYVPVSLVVDFPSNQNFRRAMSDLRSLDIAITKSEEIVEKTKITVILIGKIDLKKIIETKIEDGRVTGFEVSAPTSNEACVKVDLEVPINSVDKVLEEVKRVAKEKNALLISSV